MLYSEPVIIEGKTLKTVKRLFISAITIVSTLLVSGTPALALSVTSPSNGAVLDSDSVTLQGTATANSTVTIYDGQSLLTATVANGSGDWSATVTGLSAGSHTINIKEVGQSYGYFPALGNTNTINRILSGGTTLNPGGGTYPVTSTTGYLLPSGYSQALGLMYFGTGTSVAPGQFDINAPADPVAASSYPVGANPGSGATTLDGSKAYIANDATDNVAVVDYATNNTINTISLPAGYYSTASTSPSGMIYLPGDEIISVIDPGTDTVVRTINPGCPTTVAGLSYVNFVSGKDYYYLGCEKDGLVKKMSTVDDAVLRTYDVTGAFGSVSIAMENPINNKIYVTSSYGSGSSDTIAIVDKESGAIDGTITLTAASFAAIPTPDFQYLYAPTQGPLDGSVTNIDLIDTSTNTVIANIDTSSIGIPGVLNFESPPTTSTSLSLSVPTPPQATLASTGNNLHVLLGAASAIVLLTGYQLRRLRQQ